MKKIGLAGLLVSWVLFLSGCALAPLQIGFFYTDLKLHTGDHNQKIGSKVGESCASNILGLISVGDASVKEAAAKAGIKEITSIDYKITNILLLYGTYCVIVTGE
ncbi:hypothetical protein HRbin19_01503 [bacterium HR19]|nr:hypothetical protein HRbin19_01503 [bacterium HR19]